MSIKTVPFQLRLPEGLHLGLKVEAARNRRSLQAEILQRLEESFVDPGPVWVGPEDVQQGVVTFREGGSTFKGPDPRPGKK